MRSTTLDTKVWEPPVVALFQQLGNDFGREVWEGGLAAAAAGGGGGPQVGGGREGPGRGGMGGWLFSSVAVHSPLMPSPEVCC